ncbi:MAG: hypothetical protein ACI867_000631 [Glaciecola sp.]|jgi:hypothetical protein
MMTLTRFSAASLVLLFVASGTAHADHPEFTSYDQLVAHAAAWEDAGARVSSVATSNNGRDFLMVSVGTGPFTLISTNELHANEPSGTEQFVRLIWALLGDQGPTFEGDIWPGIAANPPILRALADDAIRAELLSRVTVVGFAMLDPDGAENAHTRDFQTNLDYSTRVTPTMAAILAALDEFNPDLLIDSHGGPPEPMNIGLVEPIGVEPAVLAFSRAAAATAWRATEAVGAPAKFFEEQPIAMYAGQHDDPFASIDEAYYSALIRGVPLTVESLQLEGLPATYTETIGLQSVDPQVSVISGASLQQNILLALAFEGAGMLTSERPGKHVEQTDTGAFDATVELAVGATRLFTTVHWGWTDPAQDWTLELLDPAGQVVASADPDSNSPYRRSRALAVGALDPGSYQIRATQDSGATLAGATLRTLWYESDPTAAPLEGIVDGNADVALCLPGTSVYRQLVSALPQTSGLAAPSCGAGGAPAPQPASKPAPAPEPAAEAAPSLPATGGGLGVAGLLAAMAVVRRRGRR